VKFTIEIEPEEFGQFISAFPAEVRQQFIDSAIKAYPMMFTEMMKSSGIKIPTAAEFNPMDPFGFFKAFSATKK
jgi:hypothetical protein